MKRRSQVGWLTALGLAAIAAGLAILVTNLRQARLREAELVRVRRDLDQTRARLRAVEAQQYAAEMRRARKVSDVKAALSAAIEERTDHRHADSEEEQQATNRFVARVDLFHLGAFRALNLSPDKVAKIEAMLNESRRRSEELRDAAISQGMKFTDPSIQEIEDQERARLQIQEEDLLGPDDFKKLHIYADDEVARTLTTDLAGRLYASDEPLTGPQGAQLTAVLASLSPLSAQGSRITDTSTIDLAAARVQAAAILSPGQQQAFMQVLDLIHSQEQMTKMVRAIKQKARAGGSNGQ